jgi:hypothetical protein
LTKSQKTDNAARGRQAFEIVQQCGAPALQCIPNLYKHCVDGATIAAELIAQGVEPPTELPRRYSSLMGQVSAAKFTTATLDDVLSILIVERSGQGWTFDIVLSNGLIYGSAEGETVATREEAIERARTSLSPIGQPFEAAEGYEHCENPDEWCQLRIGSGPDTQTYRVQAIPDDKLEEMLNVVTAQMNCSPAYLQATFANLVLHGWGIDAHPTAAAVIANLGWSHVSQSILDAFCAKYNLDLSDEAVERDFGPIPEFIPSELVN